MSPRPHFLVLTYPLQGHIALALRLARRLLAAAPDTVVTFSTTEAAHRRLFPTEPDDDHDGRLELLPFSDGTDTGYVQSTDPASLNDYMASFHAAGARSTGELVDDGRLELLPFSDGTDTGYVQSTDPASLNDYMASFHAAGARSTGELVDALAARGRAVTRVVYTMSLPWAADVARERSIPSALYWIQPAAVFAIYHHYFHGHDAGVIANHRRHPSFVVRLPGLPPLAVRDLPSFLTASTDPSDFFHCIYTTMRDLFDTLDRETPRATVLINTSQELEAGTLAAMEEAYNVLPIGPVLPAGDEAGLFKQDDEAEYMEWLDAKPANSVVYVAFGSLTRIARGQLEELFRGLQDTRKPYLCVVPKDNNLAEDPVMNMRFRNGMVVEWCDQVRVLSHEAVGCFVTHAGWNSVLESVACGVPMVCVPQMSDQRMNAWLVQREWRVGTRAEVGADGVLGATEVRRRVEEVMRGNAPWAAAEWKRVIVEALGKGGTSDDNLMAFVEGVSSD